MAAPPPLGPRPKKPGGCILFQKTLKPLLAPDASWELLAPRGGDEVVTYSPAGRLAAVSLIDGHVGIWELEPLPSLAAVLYLPQQIQR